MLYLQYHTYFTNWFLGFSNRAFFDEIGIVKKDLVQGLKIYEGFFAVTFPTNFSKQ